MSISELIKTLNATAEFPDHVGKEERKELLAACGRLRASLESPLEASVRFGFAVFYFYQARLYYLCN